VPRLFDLVSVSDPKLRLAFWYALRNTLVAADLDQASRIAYGCKDKRFSRVLTVAGQLIAGACAWLSVANVPRYCSVHIMWCGCSSCRLQGQAVLAYVVTVAGQLITGVRVCR
jgi:hypothetical protein